VLHVDADSDVAVRSGDGARRKVRHGMAWHTLPQAVQGSRTHVHAVLKAQCRSFLRRTAHKAPLPDWRRRRLCRAAGRTLAQAFLACADYSGYELVDTAQLSVPAQTTFYGYMGETLGEGFFVVATSQVIHPPVSVPMGMDTPLKDKAICVLLLISASESD
jgi:hypothetical protein